MTTVWNSPFFLRLEHFAADMQVAEAVEILKQHAAHLGVQCVCVINGQEVWVWPDGSMYSQDDRIPRPREISPQGGRQ